MSDLYFYNCNQLDKINYYRLNSNCHNYFKFIPKYPCLCEHIKGKQSLKNYKLPNDQGNHKFSLTFFE